MVGPAVAPGVNPPIMGNRVSPRSASVFAMSRMIVVFWLSDSCGKTVLRRWPSIKSSTIKAGVRSDAAPSSQTYTFGAGMLGTSAARNCKQATSFRSRYGCNGEFLRPMRSTKSLNWRPFLACSDVGSLLAYISMELGYMQRSSNNLFSPIYMSLAKQSCTLH